jgi:hypothetical protein
VRFEDLTGERLFPGSPFEHLPFLLRRRASAQPSQEAPDLERLTDPGDINNEDETEEGTDKNSSEMIDQLLREMKPNRQTLAPMREREQEERNRELVERTESKTRPRADKQEGEEPGTEHEEIGIIANEIK